jgi:hypothetical protein
MSPSTLRRPALRSLPSLARVLLMMAALGAAGCGGTNSETPWPVEPDDVDIGPEGEARKVEELRRPSAPPAEAAPAPAAPAPAAPGAPAPAAAPPSGQF